MRIKHFWIENENEVLDNVPYEVNQTERLLATFDKRSKIRKFGCEYMSVIANFIENDKNNDLDIEEELEVLLKFHTGMLCQYPTSHIASRIAVLPNRPNTSNKVLHCQHYVKYRQQFKDIYNLREPELPPNVTLSQTCKIPKKELSSIFIVNEPYEIAICLPPKCGTTNWRKVTAFVEVIQVEMHHSEWYTRLVMHRLNSGNFGNLYPNESILNLKP